MGSGFANCERVKRDVVNTAHLSTGARRVLNPLRDVTHAPDSGAQDAGNAQARRRPSGTVPC
jgi:hypothetical protein